MARPDVGIVIPAFQAAATLRQTIERVSRTGVPRARVLLVDDGSTDGTSGVARAAAHATGLEIEILAHGRNRGYGAAQKTAFRRALEAGCRRVVLVHADGQYAPEELPRMLGPLADDRADVVVGSRVAGGALGGGMPLARWVGNRVISLVENVVFGLRFVEYHTGYMAYSDRALRAIAFEALSDRFHFDGEMLLCAGKQGLRVAEIPVSTHFGPETSSLAVAPYLVEVAGVLVRYLRGGYPFQGRSDGGVTGRGRRRPGG
jgi:glycosyltransferase involved in cell wall biosynthesis